MYLAGTAGPADRSGRPRHTPDRTPLTREQAVLEHRRIPHGGGWRATAARRNKPQRVGYDYVHAAVDDYSRPAYAEVVPDESGAGAADFLQRAPACFARCGIGRIERVLTGDAPAFRRSRDFAAAVAALGARQEFIRPHCLWQNGEVERFNRTLAAEWAYRQVFVSNHQRSLALPGWVQHYNTVRAHTALGGRSPISRVSQRPD